MAGVTEKLRILIEADPKSAVRGLEKVGATAEREGRRAEKSLDKLGAGLTKVGAAMLGLGSLAAVGLFKAAQKTSDLNEAVSLTEDIFGDAADEIGVFAKEAAGGLGQSERAAREATATFGGLLDNLGFATSETVDWSKRLTELASDLGSAFNRDPADAVLALGSALRGESEPIRAFNVQLDDASVRAKAVELGLAATKAEVDNYGKAQGRLALILEQTDNVQGNFARTSDDVANATRIAQAQFEDMQAQMGQALIPVMTTVLGAANDLLGAFNSLDPATQKVVSQFALFTTGGLLLFGALATVVGQAIKMRDVFKNLSPRTKTATLATAGFTVALVAGVAAWQLWTRKSREAQDRTDRFFELLKGGEATLEQFGDSIADGLSDNELEQFAKFGVRVQEVAEAAQGGVKSWEDYVFALLDSARQSGATKAEVLLLGDTLSGIAESVLDATDRLDKHNAVTAESTKLTGDMRLEQNRLARAQATVADGTTSAADALKDMNDAMKALFDETFDVQNATDDWLDSLDGLSRSLRTNGTDITGVTVGARGNRDAFEDAARAAGEMLTAMANNGASAETLKGQQAALTRQLERVGAEFGLSGSDVRLYTDAILRVPTEAVTGVRLTGLDLARQQLEALALLLRRTEIGIDVTLPNRGGPRAHGGRVGAGAVHRVGERGPELLRSGGQQFLIPGESGHVTPNSDLGMSGGGVVQNFTIVQQPGESSAALSERIAAAGRRGFG